jgi:hypothetical protein
LAFCSNEIWTDENQFLSSQCFTKFGFDIMLPKLYDHALAAAAAPKEK